MPSFFTPSSKASVHPYEALGNDSYPSGSAAEIHPPPPYTSYPPPPGPPPPLPEQPQQQHYAMPSPSPMQPPAMPTPSAYGAVPGGPTLNSLTSLRDEPSFVQCPHCGHHVETVTEHQNGSASVFSAVVLFLFGCHSGGCLIPFCLPMCQDVAHHCPACQIPIATYSRLSQQAIME